MVGYTLRQERERQNLTINDIEQGTSIRTVYIEAIENGEYDKLPGNVYTKGFIKNYAKFLGMDPDAVVKEFAADIAELNADNTPAPAEETSEPAQTEKPDLKVVKSEKKQRLGYSINDKGNNSSNLLIVAAVVLIAALAGFAWSFLTSSEGDVAKVAPPVQQTQPVAEPVPEDKPTPVASANPAPKADTVAIQARFNDACWTLVTVDGAVVQEGTIDGGQTLSWEGKDNITFRFGNAGAVELFQDGKSLGVQGAVGDIVDKTFTKQ